MNTHLLAALVGLGLAAGAATGVVAPHALRLPGPSDGPGADEHALHGGAAGDDPHAQLGMQRPRFPPATGSVPTAEQAKSLEQASRLVVTEDRLFNPENGVRSGSGTLEDPYVISGWHVTGDLYLGDTDACVVIRENYVDGQLTLNWNDQCVHVHHNYVRDLRVNENVERTGMPTGGLIESNQITVVGQIRHYDGEFRNNVVGPFTPRDLFDRVLHESPLPFANDPVVLNIDGWNQALFHHNTITGSVSLDLHGHHHGTGFLAPHSHFHGDGKGPGHAEDHTDRWTSVQFTDNAITDPTGYGLRYDDQAHAGDDRTARSESNEMLEKEHQHHVQVEILRNTLDGAGVWIDAFGADDRLHKARNPGRLAVADNTVRLQQRDDGMMGVSTFGTGFEANTAIRVWGAKEARIDVLRNTVSWSGAPRSSPLDPVTGLFPFLAAETDPVAVRLDGVRDANVTVAGNTATGFPTGVAARQMDDKAFWAVYGNDFGGAAYPVWYDDSVANKPQDEPFAHGPEAEPEPGPGAHDH